MGSLMIMSPLRILMLYRQEGLVQTQALYSIEAPWLPKSESGTRSPSLHLRHRGNAFSTKSPPSFSLEDCIRLFCLIARHNEEVSRGGASATASASPQQSIVHTAAIIPQIIACVTMLMKFPSCSGTIFHCLFMIELLNPENTGSTFEIGCDFYL